MTRRLWSALREQYLRTPEQRDTYQASARRLDQLMVAHEQRAELVGALIKVRKAKGLTQVAVARRMGVGQSTVSQFENGLDSRVSTYQRYARACEVRLRMWIEPAEPSDS